MSSLLYLFCIFFLWGLEGKEPIKLVWLCQKPEHSWEDTWLHELFEECDAPLVDVVDLSMTQIEKRAVLVISNPSIEKLTPLLTAYGQLKIPFGVIQLSDEELHYSNMDYQSASFILKNYWSPFLEKRDKRVIFFPLGYKRNFWQGFHGEVKPAAQRAYNWSFAGNIARPQRLKMAKYMGFIERYFFYRADGFNSKHALTTAQYRDLLLDSTFSPCPVGNSSFDSFRVYESLEAGSIPIVQSTHKGDYFTHLLGPHPLLIVEDWQEAPALVHKLLENPIDLENKRLQCSAFWKKKKKDLKSQIKAVVNDTFRD
jgi:hypothetical protein